MKEFQYVIQDAVGLHARPAGLLVKKAAEFQSKITLSANGKNADAKRLIMLMSMGIQQGTEVTCRVEGEDEEQAFLAIETFFKENL